MQGCKVCAAVRARLEARMASLKEKPSESEAELEREMLEIAFIREQLHELKAPSMITPIGTLMGQLAAEMKLMAAIREDKRRFLR